MNRGFRSLLLIFALSGCAGIENVRPDTSRQEHLGQVTVISLEQVPALEFEGFVRGKGAGAAIGGAGAFVNCLGGMGGGGCSGSMCGAAFILLLGVCGVAGLVGGVVGAVTAPSADQVATSEALMARAFEVRTIQTSLRRAVEDAANAASVKLRQLPEDEIRTVAADRDYRPLAALGIDTVLETVLTRAGTVARGPYDPSTVYMQVHVRLVDTRSNAERYSNDFMHYGRRLDLAGWSADQARPLLDELNRGYRTLGTHIYESIFELYPLPDRGRHSAGGVMSSAFGLAPINPPTRGVLTRDRIIGPTFEWYAVDDLRPRFKWQAFPRPGDVAAAPDEMKRVRNVTYDLLIAAEENMAPGEIVYREEGLQTPEHVITLPLRPDARYFWTMRARFDLDGRSRVTEWGSTHFSAGARVTSPSSDSYRFRTPQIDSRSPRSD